MNALRYINLTTCSQDQRFSFFESFLANFVAKSTTLLLPFGAAKLIAMLFTSSYFKFNYYTVLLLFLPVLPKRIFICNAIPDGGEFDKINKISQEDEGLIFTRISFRR